MTLGQIAAYYGCELPGVESTREVVRTRCFLNCEGAEASGDKVLAIKPGHPGKPWKCHKEGCGKGGDLISMCDLMKPGRNASGKPRGDRFKQIVADLQAIVHAAVGAKASAAVLSKRAVRSDRSAARASLRTIQLPLTPKTTSPASR